MRHKLYKFTPHGVPAIYLVGGYDTVSYPLPFKKGPLQHEQNMVN